ncbi:MAG: efflux transporter outer membrane subunit [Deltaproteobacteria bacterium]|nr:efflux transporter outer membrane subunit [Deltaproteobacteria bacterium]
MRSRFAEVRFRLIAASLALITGGCVLGPDYHQPATQVASRWQEAANAAVDTGRTEYRDWWSLFNDPVLSRLIEIAYEQNLTLRSAGVRVLEARARLGIAIGELYPQQQQFTSSVSYIRTPATQSPVIASTYWSDVFAVQSTWEIDVWGKLRRGVESADDAFLASVANYDDVLVSLTGDVASTYVQIRTTQKQIVIARDNIEKQRLAVQIARARYEGGAATKRDVYQATNVLGSTEAAIPQLTIQLDQSKNALSVLLGMEPGRLEALLAGASEIPTAPAEVAVGIPAELLRRRPDIRKAELMAAAQCAQIGIAKADLFPTFSLSGLVGTLATDIGSSRLSGVFSAASLTFITGPTVQWNILNYGQITNNVRAQDANFQALLVDYENTVLKAQQDVENGIALFTQSRSEVVFLTQSVSAAQGALRIALIQYKEGTMDFTTVLLAEQNLYAAENSRALAQGMVPLGVIATYRAMGGGWQLREGHDFVPAGTRNEMAKRTNWGQLLAPQLLRPQAPGLPSASDTGPLIRLPE